MCRITQKEELGWQELFLSQSHSCADYCFWFEVRTNEKGRLVLTGECRDDRGEPHEEGKGLRLKKKTVKALQQMQLHTLANAQEKIEPEGMAFLMDATTSSFSLRCGDGKLRNKEIPQPLFMEIQKLLRKYLIK